MNNHCFLSEFPCSMRFFTLKPESWKNDLKSELVRLVKIKEDIFNKEIEVFKNKINDLINADLLINGKKY